MLLFSVMCWKRSKATASVKCNVSVVCCVSAVNDVCVLRLLSVIAPIAVEVFIAILFLTAGLFQLLLECSFVSVPSLYSRLLHCPSISALKRVTLCSSNLFDADSRPLF